MQNNLKWLRATAVGLLLFNGAGALYGGYSLITDPTGYALQLPLHYLKTGLFSDYFIPGLFLFVFNGLGSLMAALYTIARFSKYYMWVFLQGMILIVWILIQFFMVTHSYYLQYVMGGLGCALIVLGIWMKKIEERRNRAF